MAMLPEPVRVLKGSRDLRFGWCLPYFACLGMIYATWLADAWGEERMPNR